MQHLDKVGQHPNRPGQICFETYLLETVYFEVKNTGKTVEKPDLPEVAEVLIYCHAESCPVHEKFKSKN